MFFEIENTPEHIRRARRKEIIKKDTPKEECPRLILAPFSRTPQVVFEDVRIGSLSERTLEVYNPSKQAQQITLCRSLPPGLEIHLPGEWLVLEPETCYCLTMMWTPMQPTALRETVRFTNENRGRYDVIVVLKSFVNAKGKGSHQKTFKISPGKIKKKPSKKSPVAIYKKKAEIIYNTTKIKKTYNVVQSSGHKGFKLSNKENMSTFNDYSMESYQDKCPFDSPTSIDFNFDTAEIFSNFRRPTENILQNTYDKCSMSESTLPLSQNILKPLNNQIYNRSASDIFDNLTFTPLKTCNEKSDKLDKGPKIIMSLNSDSELDDSLNVKIDNKENEHHSIICVTSTQPPNKWLTIDHTTIDRHAVVDHHFHQSLDSQYTEPVNIPTKKIPNTSSPKETSSLNFSINTDFSRISDLSFFPQRFSTERKVLPKVNETHEINDDPIKVSSDTYTKESPNTPMEQQARQMYLESRQPHLFVRDNPKMCRQALFRDLQLRATEAYERNSNPYENIFSQNDLRSDMKSPPRSLTPPLQSIPEESTQFSETHVLDKTDKSTATFTINRTFDKGLSRNSLSSSMRQSWSKKAVRVEPELWKLPVPLSRKSLKPKTSFVKDSLTGTISNTREVNKTINQNISLNQTGNVYSQSFTVDPFLSSTYFYDEQAVEKFEIEFKRWLNCILTPPADLESNIEQKIDVGKAWIENRNREVPLAPTKEQVSSRYHNSHRLESLRRAARSLLLSPEIAQVFQKLNAQIEKKLIVIRNDRNLHLDVGLQKIIMELLLSYNPLWLRIGLEAIYGLILPLKSNSDIEGLTSFIIHRMFKNPYLKNKHSKSTAPNMLLPAYMEAIKKFTLKKFFMLVFFLDQAKQRKLISHDPCLFCRNAICKESREIIIRFTRELIAGIGDITKHLRPLGYVVNHKQSYLDEYKFAVHNLALDIRDGVRLTKVMEIILMKNGLLSQLRTPAISRLQKIHNVQVALNALKESNFVIVGDITAQDIADGHREKTLSLLWQIIHVFRAPLFEKAANVIQTWWRKKFEVIVEKRKEEERTRQKQNEAASLIQCWWRRIQYNRYVEWQMQQVTKATIVVQKYWRMWLCRSRFHKLKSSVLKIEDWFRSIKIMKEAKKTLIKLKLEQLEIRRNAATILQSYIRRWLCMKRYKETLKKVVLIQSIVRRFLARTHYLQLKKSVVYVQQKYRSKLLMLKEMQKLAEKKKCVLMIQSYYRMMKQRKLFEKLKKSVIAIEERYIALVNMRYEYKKYQHLKSCTILLQARFRARKYRSEYIKQKNIIIKLQRKIKAQLLMKKERAQYLKLKTATVFLQNRVRSYLAMKLARQHYITLRKSTVLIQRRIRLYLLMKTQRNSYLQLRNAVIVIQKYYRNMSAMRQARSSFLKLKNAAVVVQRQFRAQILMKHNKREYETLRSTAVLFQRRFRAQMKMREERVYMRLRLSCITIQIFYRSYLLGKRERKCFLKQREAAITIQKWFRNCQKTKVTKQEYKQLKQACVTIQRIYRTNIISRNQRQEYIRLRTATVCIQKYYRSYVEMKVVRDQYIQLKTATVSIQKFYKRYMQTKKQQLEFLQIKTAVQVIQRSYRHYKQAKMIRLQYCQLRQTAIYIQRKYKSLMAMRRERKAFLDLKKSVCIIQHQFRALHAMRRQREAYLNLRSAILVLQTRFRAQCLMKKVRSRYITILKACITIQVYYRAYVTGKKQRECYLKMKRSAVILQQQFRALIAMKKDRNSYLTIRSATLTIQNKFRAHSLMLEHRKRYQETVKACIAIQRAYTAYRLGKKQRIKYIKIKLSIINIQKWFRNIKRTKQIRNQYQELRNAVIYTQRRFRANVVKREQRRNEAAARIQTWYRSLQKRNECQTMYLKIKVCIIKIQSIIRMYILRKRFVTMKNAAVTIQSHYRSFNLTKTERQKYIQIRKFIIRLQSIVRCYIARQRYLKLKSAVLTVQAAYRLKRQRCITRKRREAAAICIQKNVRRYFVQSWYQSFLKRVTYIQKLWRGKLLTRRIRYEFLRNRNVITKLQAAIKGYLVRKHIQCKREEMLKKKELQQRHWAASRIQALFRGHKARIDVSGDRRVAELRRRWREGALQSTQESLKERNEEAMEVLRNMSDIETVIRAFRSLELLTEVFPMMYNSNASSIVRRVYIYMSVTNRSISSIEVLKSAASVLVNLTRYRITGPKIYARDRIPPILKFMWRFSNSETHLFCILSTYLWLFSKYDVVREDLQEFLHMPENVKILVTIKKNVERMKRMASNARKSHTPQSSKFVSHTGNQSYSDLNYSLCSTSKNSSILLPALEPDYGIVRADKPRYFEDAYQAISCLFYTFKL